MDRQGDDESDTRRQESRTTGEAFKEPLKARRMDVEVGTFRHQNLLVFSDN